MANYIINTILLFATAYLFGKIPCCKNNRGEMAVGELTIEVGKTIYKVCGHFKPQGMTLTAKLLRNMGVELEKGENLCYTENKSQKGLDCKQSVASDAYERSII